MFSARFTILISVTKSNAKLRHNYKDERKEGVASLLKWAWLVYFFPLGLSVLAIVATSVLLVSKLHSKFEKFPSNRSS